MGLSRAVPSPPKAVATRQRRPRCPKFVKVGSDFSGLDAGTVAMKRLGVNVSLEFVCDVSKASQKVLKAAHGPKCIFPDILARSPEDAGYVDVYFWTPPCQDLSSSGTQAGLKGPRQTGMLIKKSMQYIKTQRPRLAIFENVPAILQSKFAHIPRGIREALASLGYKVFSSTLNSRDYGLPQDRRRVFIVAIKADAMKCDFKWPTVSQPAPSINTILDPWVPSDKAGRLPSRPAGADLCKAAYKQCYQHGRDPRRTPVLVDVDCSPKYAVYGVDEAKTLTATRGGSGGPWLSTRGRRLTINELMKLQGFRKEDIQMEAAKVTERQLGHMLGNAVSVNTIGCILQEALWSAGLIMTRAIFPRTGTLPSASM